MVLKKLMKEGLSADTIFIIQLRMTRKKVYEIISRNKDIKTIDDIRNEKTDGVVIVVTDEADEHILINKEYRMSVGDYVYNFPAGLIDEGKLPKWRRSVSLRKRQGLTLL